MTSWLRLALISSFMPVLSPMWGAASRIGSRLSARFFTPRGNHRRAKCYLSTPFISFLCRFIRTEPCRASCLAALRETVRFFCLLQFTDSIWHNLARIDKLLHSSATDENRRIFPEKEL